MTQDRSKCLNEARKIKSLLAFCIRHTSIFIVKLPDPELRWSGSWMSWTKFDCEWYYVKVKCVYACRCVISFSSVFLDCTFQNTHFLSKSFVAAGQLVEKLLVERVTFFTTACWHEDVAADEFVHNFAVGGHAGKSNVHVAFKLDGHLEESHTPKDLTLLLDWDLNCCCSDFFQEAPWPLRPKTHFVIWLSNTFRSSQCLHSTLTLSYSTTTARAPSGKMWHLSYVPVDVPLLHVVVAPGLHHITHTQVNPDQAVGSNSQDLVFPTALKPVGQAKASSVSLWHHAMSYKRSSKCLC